MLDGEVIKDVFFFIPNNPDVNANIPNIPANPFPGCCNDFVLKVLADDTSIELQNDISGVLWWFDAIITGATMNLWKWVDGAWVDQGILSDNTYGTFYDFAFFTNKEGQNFIGYQIEWSKVLSTLGTGSYKVITTYENPFGVDQTVESYEYCLRIYSPILADGTMRLEYWLNGITGDIEDDTKIKDFGSLNWYNSLRLPGVFGYPEATYKEEDVEYNNGQYLYVEDGQSPTYWMKIWMIPFFIHEILRTDYMMADTLSVTDYNSKNNGFFVKKYLRKDSGYKPNWNKLQSNLASVELTFKPQFNRFRKLR